MTPETTVKRYAHTTLPWAISPDGNVWAPYAKHVVLARLDSNVSDAEQHANAAFIVEACNNYQQLQTKLAAKEAENARLREALRRVQNNAAARKWNSESVDRADMDAWESIEATARAALAQGKAHK